ncbi:MAG: cAMP regulatory protein [Planctomycetota bacterium]|jgi:predicted nucleotide-binding protein
MIERFQGEEGKRRLTDAMQTQVLVNGDKSICTYLIDSSDLQEVKPNQTLIKQNDGDTDLYFIIAGKMRIEVNGRSVAIRHAGTHVGEMALIDCKARRSASVIADETSVVVKISESSFAKVANDYPVLWRRIAIELCDRLRNRNHLVRPPNGKPNVFICSSVEYLVIAEQIQLGLQHHDSDVSIWTDQVFGLSTQTMEDLDRQLRAADFAIAIVADEDVVTARKKRLAAPRDNVIFELGLFMGQLGRERTVIVSPRGINLKLPSDLNGLNPLYFNKPDDFKDKQRLAAAIGPVCTQLKSLFDELKPR